MAASTCYATMRGLGAYRNANLAGEFFHFASRQSAYRALVGRRQ
jgi:hypothetical protein